MFSVGFISRFILNTYFNINVLTDFTHPVSIIFYLIFSLFISCSSDFFDSLPNINFKLKVITYYVNKTFVYLISLVNKILAYLISYHNNNPIYIGPNDSK